MVKPLADILAEIEERESIQLFGGGPADHSTTEAPADPGQDDTLGEEDEITGDSLEDYGGLLDAGVYGGVVIDGKFQYDHKDSKEALDKAAAEMHQGMDSYADNITDANIEQVAYITRNPAYMDMLKDPIKNPFTKEDKDALVKDTLSSRGILDPSLGTILSSLASLALGVPGGGMLHAYAENKAKDLLVQH